MTVLILAGGKGTRIHSYCGDQAKCLLTVGGETLLGRKLDQIAQVCGATRMIIIVRQTEHLIQKIIGNSWMGIPVFYVRQPEGVRGPVGASYSALPLIEGKEPVLVTLGDEYYEGLDYKRMYEFHKKTGSQLTVSLIRTSDEEQIRKNFTVSMDEKGCLRNAVEKPVHILSPFIGCGSFLMEYAVYLDFYREHEGQLASCEMTDWINDTVRKGRECRGFPFTGYYQNINTAEDYFRLPVWKEGQEA